MSVRILIGDVRSRLADLPDDSVHCVVTSPRNGRFAKGERRSPATEFQPGQHWRPRKPHWEKEWLVREYFELERSTGDIAAGIGCTDINVIYWLKKHGIPRRSIAGARAIKKWGLSGAANGMHGRTGALNPRYVDGSSPERQRLYVQGKGRAFLRTVYARDNFRCQKCSAPNTGPRSLHAHHIRPWAGNPALRFDADNAVTLCRKCHSWVHSKANTEREFIR